MTLKAAVSALTATGDTVKTLIDTVTVPAKARKIIGFWCYAVAGAAITTAEAISGIVELESEDLTLTPMQLPLDIVTVLTSGAVVMQPKVWPVNIPVNGKERIQVYVTMDMAQTGALKARAGFIYDMAD